MNNYKITKQNQNYVLNQVQNAETMNYSLTLAEHTVYKRYLPELSLYPAAEPALALLAEKTQDCALFCQMKKLVCKQGEDILQKLSTVYHASMALGCTLVVMIDVKNTNAPADIYIGVRNSGENQEEMKKLQTSFQTLRREMKSNFPGTELEAMDSISKMPKIVEDIFGNHVKNISAVSCVAALRDKSKTEDKKFIQGIERFIDAMQGNTYTAVFLAEPVSVEEQAQMRYGYEELYSTLSAFRKSTWSYTENESHAVLESLSHSISQSITESTSHTNSHTSTKGGNIELNLNFSGSKSSSKTFSTSKSSPTKTARAGAAISTIGQAVAEIPHPLAKILGLVATGAGNAMQGESVTESVGNAIGKTLGISGGIGVGGHLDSANSISDTSGSARTNGTQETSTSGTQDTQGTARTIQIENTNKHIEEMLHRIDEQLRRIQESEDYGAYQCGAYFLSGKPETCQLAANTYRALMLGEGSSVESSAINSWNDAETVRNMKEYLKRFTHPVFGMPYADMSDKTLQFMRVSAGTVVSGLELPLHLGLPTKSVYGLPVVEHAEFGRNITITESVQNVEKIEIGKIYHMGQPEQAAVSLDIENLTAHTFITGSTGAGKSNTIYQILDKLSEKQIAFLVIEPAKGEYKKLFSGYDVKIYGTNPNQADTEMLKLNPFSFPQGIHILEHLERLTEIFNACWAMYAAMPAILKSAIQRAYESAGWDTETSVNRYGYQIFPDFSDVHREIRNILEESDYSADNKSDYTGALVTRIQSLTNGISGLVFKSNGLTDSELFDRNVIIDLSRTGSSETKSLIMGILVLKLQEYRMNTVKEINTPLRHVTVLEEAHHLLKRTSAGQSDESSNLQGKAIEMLTNAIAEMRTYGEGFIIADQSPALLDIAVIRNTNTKILLRLPEQSDCELTGHAAGLNDTQISELSRLEQGIAVIRQSGWLEPVLCKVNQFHPAGRKKNSNADCKKKTENIAVKLLDNIINYSSPADIQSLEEQIMMSELSTSVKCDFMRCILEEDTKNAKENFESLVYDFLDGENAMKCVQKYHAMNSSVESACLRIIRSFKYSVKEYPKTAQKKLLIYVIKEHSRRHDSCLNFIEAFLNQNQPKDGEQNVF